MSSLELWCSLMRHANSGAVRRVGGFFRPDESQKRLSITHVQFHNQRFFFVPMHLAVPVYIIGHLLSNLFQEQNDIFSFGWLYHW